MTIIIEDSEEIPCSYCDRLRQTFLLIALTAVLPMVVFASLLLVTVPGEMDPQVEFATTRIVEFVFGLLFVQLFVATSVLISFMKRNHPLPLKYHYWYFFFHITIMVLFTISSFVMTVVNNGYVTSGLVFFGGVLYFYNLYNFMKVNKNVWTTLRRAY